MEEHSRSYTRSRKRTEREKRDRKRAQRANKKLTSQVEEKKISKAVFSRSVVKACNALPGSPKSKARVIKRIATIVTPSLMKTARKHRLDMRISEQVGEEVKEFYLSDGISYQDPGMKDFFITKDESGEKTKLQKKYLTMTLKEAFCIFKIDHPAAKVVLTSFCDYRPIQVKLRHKTPVNVCLCEEHENMRLLISAVSWLPNSTTECIANIVCHNDNAECMFQTCSSCAKTCHFQYTVRDQLDADLDHGYYTSIQDTLSSRARLA